MPTLLVYHLFLGGFALFIDLYLCISFTIFVVIVRSTSLALFGRSFFLLSLHCFVGFVFIVVILFFYTLIYFVLYFSGRFSHILFGEYFNLQPLSAILFCVY